MNSQAGQSAVPDCDGASPCLPAILVVFTTPVPTRVPKAVHGARASGIFGIHSQRRREAIGGLLGNAQIAARQGHFFPFSKKISAHVDVVVRGVTFFIEHRSLCVASSFLRSLHENLPFDLAEGW